ncbi:MAG: hypothetical protein SVM79_03015 [Chloroflexota bacterium]|nr:hypothetical protein [Chloroflexota bacterium]
MVTVTEGVKHHLKDILVSEDVEDGIGLRLMSKVNGDLILKMDRELAGDHVVVHEGTSVLFIDETILGCMGAATIDLANCNEGSEVVVISD